MAGFDAQAFNANGNQDLVEGITATESFGPLQIERGLDELIRPGTNPLQRITSIVHSDATATPVSTFDYQYDPAGQLDAATENSESIDYTHDTTGQLTDALRSVNPTEAYRYDDSGNRTTANGEAYTPAEHNRYESQGEFTFQYDHEGNLVQKTNTVTGEVWTYEFDHRNRLTKATQTDSVNSVLSVVNFTYDALDRRIAKETTADSQPPTAHIFHYDGDHIWKEDTDSRTTYFLYGDRIDQILARHRSDDGLAFHLKDRMGSIRAIADTDGNVLSQTEYSAFGEIITRTNSEQADQLGFTGRELDEETGLYYYRARYYDPGLGSFISEDPIEFQAGDDNMYRYAGNMPFSAFDPYGLTTTVTYSNKILKPGESVAARELGRRITQNIANQIREQLRCQALESGRHVVKSELAKHLRRAAAHYSKLGYLPEVVEILLESARLAEGKNPKHRGGICGRGRK